MSLRQANPNEIQANVKARDKLVTFQAIEQFAQEFFAHEGQVPVRVEVDVSTESEYDDEGGSITTANVIDFRVLNAQGERLTAFVSATKANALPGPHRDQPNDGLEPPTATDHESFKDDVLEYEIAGLEWDIHNFFWESPGVCVFDLSSPPPTPASLFLESVD
jgi:hypothetical protein